MSSEARCLGLWKVKTKGRTLRDEENNKKLKSFANFLLSYFRSLFLAAHKFSGTT